MHSELIKKGIRNPHGILPFLNRKYKNLKWGFYRRIRKIPSQKRLIENLVSTDQFVLVVLDACRYDYFSQNYENYISGDLSHCWSPANHTPDWVPAVFPDQYDIQYVSANPYAASFPHTGGCDYCAGKHFEKVFDVFDFGWDNELQTTPPEAVTNTALQALSEEQTRLIVHYIQPHQPYIGEYQFEHWSEKSRVESTISGTDREKFLQNTTNVTPEEVKKYQISWGDKKKYELEVETPQNGEISKWIEHNSDDKLRRAYEDNLKLVLEEVERLVSRVDCPVFITADHGELLGEGGRYMHGNITHPILRKVPWLKIDNDIIGTKEKDGTRASSNSNEAEEFDVQERLAHLGYK